MEAKSDTRWFSTCGVLCLCLGSVSYGYDFSIISTTVGQPGFYSSLALTTDTTDTALYAYTQSITGTIFGLFSAGAVLGALFTGRMSDAHGRKKTLMLAAIVYIVGGAIQPALVYVGMFIVGRFITGFAAAIFVTLVPIYLSEIAPPSSRGLLVAQHGAFFVLRYSMATWIGVGSFFAKNSRFQWRFPLSLQMLWPSIMIPLIVWAPESPRWLVTHGKSEEAWDILSKLHFNLNDPDQTFARKEFHQITSQVATDRVTYGDVSVLDPFRKPYLRRRMLLAALVMWTSQANGNIVIYSNIVSLVSKLGYSNAIALVLSDAYITLGCTLNFFNAAILGRLGRLCSMLIGFSGAMLCNCLSVGMVATYGDSNNTSGMNAGVAMLFLYLAFYAAFGDTTIYVYCTEIFPNHLRAKGMAWSISIFMISSLPFVKGSPLAYANIGRRFNVIFICLTAVNIILLWRFVPETKGLSLQEINGIFGEEVTIELTRLNDEKKVEMESSKVAEQNTDQEVSMGVDSTEEKGVYNTVSETLK